jgi:hypothetical protein
MNEQMYRIIELLIIAGALPYLHRIWRKTSEIAASVVHLPETIEDHEERLSAVEERVGVKPPPKKRTNH